MKNLFKKIGALLVVAVMVLSMCTAVFADGNATIKLTDFNTADSVECMQIIQKDESTTSGCPYCCIQWSVMPGTGTGTAC